MVQKCLIQDQMSMKYPAGEKIDYSPPENFDPGRIRYEPFFRKMYGNTKNEVVSNLVTINWMPKTVNKPIFVTKVNGVDLKLQKISDELDKLPDEIKEYAKDIAAFMWRNIQGAKRLSMHSFGIAIDINSKHLNYWQWSKPDKTGRYLYENKIPFEIVRIFEENGFIWGGRWYHFDTMHFEYRPELLLNNNQSSSASG
ncbi:MAG: M15 family metallopeptidase [Deltaproteobacteria bacterium]|nr:M15 family metallopeptidase [Deltaproteobacteria bacterium]